MHIDLPKKRYYKIGEVANAFGVNTSLIRFWEGEFEERGFTLEGAKQKLKQNLNAVVDNHEIISRLETVKAELIKIKNQL